MSYQRIADNHANIIFQWYREQRYKIQITPPQFIYDLLTLESPDYFFQYESVITRGFSLSLYIESIHQIYATLTRP